MTKQSTLHDIMKTRLYNFDPLKTHFYIVNLGFTGVYIIFSYFAKKIDCGYSLECLDEAVLTSTHNLCFEQEYEKYQISFLSENFPFLVIKFSIYLNRSFHNKKPRRTKNFIYESPSHRQ